MADDTYASYAHLARYETAGRDYRITVRDVGSPTTIIAPHGGRIEPHTSDIARDIAEDTFNYYGFEGIKPRDNGRLHLTSHRFDEPQGVDLVARSRIVVAVHACTGNGGNVYLGGLDTALIGALAGALTAGGVAVSRAHYRFQGSAPANICNRGATGRGVQLEITRDLRDDPEKRRLIAEAVRVCLAAIDAGLPA